VTTRCELAALNNALWCDTVCRAHGVPGEFVGGVWLNRHAPPPYHSNLVVVGHDVRLDPRQPPLRELFDRPPVPDWSVKDSHSVHDLAAAGFAPLFDAQWIWHEPPRASAAPAGKPGSGWDRVVAAADLERWNHAWAAEGTDPVMRGRPPQFPPSLLADGDIAFFALRDGARIVGGAIANRTAPVVGVSNTFGATRSSAGFWRSLVDKAAVVFPGLALVGYERGDELAAAIGAGFEPIGPLRVWIRHG
jgi:hypothetical protein